MEVATGSSIWRKLRGGDRGEVDEWMEQSLMELALIELGSVVYIL